MIDHSIFAPLVGIQRDGQSLSGELRGPDGAPLPLSNSSREQVGQEGKSDILELRTLLRAAGIESLNAESDYVSKKKNDTHGERESFRMAGMVLMVYYVYSNTDTYNLYDVNYHIDVTRINKTEFKAVQPILTKNITSRKLYNRHGVRLVFQQVGQLGRFDFQTMLLSFVSGLGLLAAATLVVDQLAVRVLPQRKIYREYKINETEEIDELEKQLGNSASDEDLKSLIRSREKLPTARRNNRSDYQKV